MTAPPAVATRPRALGPSRVRAPLSVRWRAMARTGLRMMFHDRLKLLGSITGVVFAVVLAAQQLSILLALLQKNTQFIDAAGADVWVTPPNLELLQPGDPMSDSLVAQARTTPGVLDAAPLVLSGGTLKKPDGGSMPVQIVGVELPARMGGPYNVVAGDVSALGEPDTLFFEDSERDRFGGLNLGSVRELNGHLVRVGGFTWGLVPFGPAYTFADIDLARDLCNVPRDKESFVLVKLRPGADRRAVMAELARRMPEQMVIAAPDFSRMVTVNLLKQQLGASFGISTAIGLIVGFVIVALTMFSAVVDNLREFGTLKAIGCTNWDLAKLLFVQSVSYGLIGSFVGLGLVSRMTEGIRSAKLAPIVPHVTFLIAPLVMTALCVLASSLALGRIRKLEPGMVFR